MREEEEDEKEEKGEDTTVRSAVIKNIQNSNQEFLSILIENVLRGSSTELTDFSIEIIPESNCAVVTFSNRKGKSCVVSSSPSHTKY